MDENTTTTVTAATRGTNLIYVSHGSLFSLLRIRAAPTPMPPEPSLGSAWKPTPRSANHPATVPSILLLLGIHYTEPELGLPTEIAGYSDQVGEDTAFHTTLPPTATTRARQFRGPAPPSAHLPLERLPRGFKKQVDIGVPT